MKSLLVVAAVALLVGGAPSAHAGEAGWVTSETEALELAKQQGKPVMLDFWAKWCVACIQLGKETFPDPAVKPLLDGFILAKLDMDAPENQGLWEKYAMSELPQVWFVRPDGTPLSELTLRQFESPAEFAARLQKVRAKLGLGGAAAPVEQEPSPGAKTSGTRKLGAPITRDLGDVQATARADRPHITVRLVADRSNIVPDSTIRMGVHFSIQPRWHIYWKNSGDAGLPTSVQFELPAGYVAGELRWPTPHRYTESGGLTAYGYSDEAMLFADVHVPSELPEGDVTLGAAVEWLVCEKNCVPGKADLKLTLPRGTGGAGAVSPAATAFDAFLPTVAASDDEVEEVDVRGVLSLSAVRPGDPFDAVFEVKPRSGSLRFPEDPMDAAFLPEVGHGIDIERIDQNLIDGGKAAIFRIRGVGGELGTGDGAVAGIVQVVAGDGQGRLLRLAVSQPIPRAERGAAVQRTTDPALAALPPLPDDPAKPALTKGGAVVVAGAEVSLWQMLLFALIGGLLLNVMPCVLPVLSIKAIGLVRQAGEDRSTIWHHGLAFGAGVMVSFLVLALFVIGLKASGELVGWGFQFQDPVFVVTLMTIVFAFSLSLFGVFEVNLPGMQAAAGVSSRHGLSGSFFNGIFATLLATPCTAPFLGTALGFAFGQPPLIILSILMTVGLGLALPFVILARFPAWLRKVPRPGPWMDHFKHAMGFLLIGTVLWLLDVLSHQVTTRGLIGALIFLGIVSVAVWLYGRFGGLTAPRVRQWAMAAFASLLVVLGATQTLQFDRPATAAECIDEGGDSTDPNAWTHFTDERVTQLSGAGNTVFIDFTAAWCWTCKVNENTVIESDAVASVMRELGVVKVKADWTNKDEAITAWLRRFDRAGVPLYVILPGRDPESPIVLPEVLTRDILIEHLRMAGPSVAKQS